MLLVPRFYTGKFLFPVFSELTRLPVPCSNGKLRVLFLLLLAPSGYTSAPVIRLTWDIRSIGHLWYLASFRAGGGINIASFTPNSSL